MAVGAIPARVSGRGKGDHGRRRAPRLRARPWLRGDRGRAHAAARVAVLGTVETPVMKVPLVVTEPVGDGHPEDP